MQSITDIYYNIKKGVNGKKEGDVYYWSMNEKKELEPCSIFLNFDANNDEYNIKMMTERSEEKGFMFYANSEEGMEYTKNNSNALSKLFYKSMVNNQNK